FDQDLLFFRALTLDQGYRGFTYRETLGHKSAKLLIGGSLHRSRGQAQLQLSIIQAFDFAFGGAWLRVQVHKQAVVASVIHPFHEYDLTGAGADDNRLCRKMRLAATPS